jgi:hypothetical protein
MVPNEKNGDLMAPLTAIELMIVLQSFPKNRAPSPDGWPIEFNLNFFDLIVNDLFKCCQEI